MKYEEQDSQELEYQFPYHYVARMPRLGFSQHFTDTWGINYVSTIEFLLREIEKERPISVIDIGCGDGRLTREIKLHLPEATVAGVDYSTKAIKLAEAMNYDIDDLDFRAENIIEKSSHDKFDVAILMEVFEHIPLEITQDFLTAVKRLIRVDGVLLLTVPHANKPLEYKHFQHFTIDTISEQLSPHFTILEAIPFERRSFLRWLLNLTLCNRYFVLNNSWLLNLIYCFYSSHLFSCTSETESQRIFVKAKPKFL